MVDNMPISGSPDASTFPFPTLLHLEEKLKQKLNVNPTRDQMLLEPYHYLADIPGKGVRSRLIGAFNQWLKIDGATLGNIAQVIQQLHTASLLIDDIEDNSVLRRGVPVAHKIYGVAQTINCANYVYFKAMERLTQFGSPKATAVFLEELLNLHVGQGLDIWWRDNSKCPTEDEYRAMVLDKTGGLFRLAVRLMQVFSMNKEDFLPLVDLLGFYFQVRDDYINLVSTDYADQKSYCEDITEGKFSFPIIHSIRTRPEDHRLLHILKQHTTDVEVKKHAVSYIRSTGSLDYTFKVIEKIEQDVLDEIDRLGGNDQLLSIMKSLRLSSPM